MNIINVNRFSNAINFGKQNIKMNNPQTTDKFELSNKEEKEIKFPEKVFIKTKSGEDVEANVKTENINNNIERLSLLDSDGKTLGYSIIETIPPKSITKNKNKYLDNGAIFVTELKSYDNDKYSGIGTQLQKLAVLRSREAGFGGRTVLLAAYNSHGFHFKMGFRPLMYEDSKRYFNKFILKAIEKADREKTPCNTTALGSFQMYLPEENIPFLLAK
ncbi:MAG: hypothetical protein LUG16_05590 [Candidatus Gastranaerophilales bacterium]|nr:hypothetical protein [Candidatus Gastranaerophilales bacterium]